jgi:hypothetical protein
MESNYINSSKYQVLYKKLINSPYFIDKTKFLSSLFDIIETAQNYICITRPRRFGKTCLAQMISAFFSKGLDGHSIFDNLQISQDTDYLRYLSKHNVVYLDLRVNAGSYECYEDFEAALRDELLSEAKNIYPTIDFSGIRAINKIFDRIYRIRQEPFIFVLDEWDAIFQQKYMADVENRKQYLYFLNYLLKDQAYVKFAYMTGIMPIAKYSDGSDLNMFIEYNMSTDPRYSSFLGFTQPEVDCLYQKYLKLESNPAISMEMLRFWYDGYKTADGQSLYNPFSIVNALSDNSLKRYWVDSGPYNTLYNHIKNERKLSGKKSVVEDIKHLIDNDQTVKVNIKDYIHSSFNLSTREEILTTLVLYGLLSYSYTDKSISIPNNELRGAFLKEIKDMKEMGKYSQFVKNSEDIINATIELKSQTLEMLLTKAHKDLLSIRSSILSESELAQFIARAYSYALYNYDMKMDYQSGQGYADIILNPCDIGDSPIIIELKFNHLPEDGLNQIIAREYFAPFADAHFKAPNQKQSSKNMPVILAAISYMKIKNSKKKTSDKKNGKNRADIPNWSFKCLIRRLDNIDS